MNECEVRIKQDIEPGNAVTDKTDLELLQAGPSAADRTWHTFGQSPSGSPTAMLIRIFGKKNHEPYGDIVHYDLKKPVPYQGAAELVLRIDAISRSLDSQDGGNTFRSIRRPRDAVTGINVLSEEYWQEQGESPPPKVRDTIYLQLIGRQHTSIQGRIWGRVTKKRYVSFRSALELIYLLSEAV